MNELTIIFGRNLDEAEQNQIRAAVQAAIGSHLLGHTPEYEWASTGVGSDTVRPGGPGWAYDPLTGTAP